MKIKLVSLSVVFFLLFAGVVGAGCISQKTTGDVDLKTNSSLMGTYVVVDTGQNSCYDDSVEISYPERGEAFYGQDAQLYGNQPSYVISSDALSVFDENTNLTWTKSADWNFDGVIDSDDKFVFSDFLEYPVVLNAQNFGGFSDWRAPSIKELYSLIDFRGTDPAPDSSDNMGLNPFIDTDFFDFDYGDIDAGERIIDAQFWSSTEYVSTTMGGSPTTFGVNFADGRIKGYGREYPNGGEMDQYAFFVRGNPLYGLNNFSDNSDGTISDFATGLMWSKEDSGVGMNWQDALLWVQQKNDENYLGYDDWRLPNAKELQSIVDYSLSPDTSDSASIDPIFGVTEITNVVGEKDYPFYWTSTTHARQDGSGSSAAYVCFGRGLGSMDGVNVIDVHGAGCQRSDPKDGDPQDYPSWGNGPQGDVQRVFNYVRLVRDGLSENTAPSKPDMPDGPSSGTVGEVLSFSSTGVDADGNQIWYWFEWGDGEDTGWLGPFESGQACNASHSWQSKDDFELRVKIKDSEGAQSEWSDPLPISVPKSSLVLSVKTFGESLWSFVTSFVSLFFD